MWIILRAEEATLGVSDLAEVEFDEVLPLELAGGLDSTWSGGAGDIVRFADGGYLRVCPLLRGSGAGYGGGGWLGLGLFGGEVGFTDGFGFEAVGFLEELISGVSLWEAR